MSKPFRQPIFAPNADSWEIHKTGWYRIFNLGSAFQVTIQRKGDIPSVFECVYDPIITQNRFDVAQDKLMLSYLDSNNGIQDLTHNPSTPSIDVAFFMDLYLETHEIISIRVYGTTVAPSSSCTYLGKFHPVSGITSSASQ